MLLPTNVYNFIKLNRIENNVKNNKYRIGYTNLWVKNVSEKKNSSIKTQKWLSFFECLSERLGKGKRRANGCFFVCYITVYVKCTGGTKNVPIFFRLHSRCPGGTPKLTVYENLNSILSFSLNVAIFLLYTEKHHLCSTLDLPIRV